MDGLTITGITVTKDAARAVLTTAVEAGHTYGFGYWGKASHVKRNRAGQVESLTVTEHEAYGYGSETKRTRAVNLDLVEPAILKMVQDGGVACKCQGLINQLHTDDLDGPLAEAIVQVICFGEVIYG